MLSINVTIALSQTLKVTVVDEQNKALSDVVLSSLNASDSTLLKTEFTAHEGKAEFFVPLNKEIKIHASLLGYADYYSPNIKFNRDENKEISITLKENTEKIGEVIVSASKALYERKLDKLIVNVNASITAAGSTVLEVLEKAPGVLVNQESSINLKGKAGVLIMIDGKPTPMSGTDLVTYLKTIPAANIDRIEIISNPSAKYDAAGNAGIIDIRFKKDKSEGFNGGLNASLGQGFYTKPTASINTNYRTKKWNLYNSYSYSQPKNFTRFYINRKFFGTNREVNSIFDQTSFTAQPIRSHNARLGVDFYASKNTVIGVMATGTFTGNNRSGNTNSIITDKDDVLLYNTKTDLTLNNKRANGFANANLKHSFNDSGKELTMDVDYGMFDSGSKQNVNNGYFDPSNILTEASKLYSDQNGNIKVQSAKIDYTHPLGGGKKLELGAKTSLVKTDNDIKFFNVLNSANVFDPTNSNHFIYKENINALYTNYLIEKNKYDFQFGLRMEQSKTNGNQLTTGEKFERNRTFLFPSGVANYKHSEAHQFSLSYSRRIDRPNYQQLNLFRIFVDPYTFVVGDPSLKPVLTNAYSLSHTFKGRYTTELSYSRSSETITDIFTQDDVSKISFQIPANIQDVDNIFISSTIPFNVKSWMSGMFVPSVYWAEYRSPLLGGNLNNSSLSWDARLQNNFTLGKQGWSAEINSFYQSENVWGQFTIKDLAQVSLGVQKLSTDKQTTWKLAVSDIFKTNRIAVVVDYLNQDFHTNRTWDSRVATFSLSHRFGKNTVTRSRQRTTGIEDEKKRAG
jgi:iron complex outermembrane recepter protein